jgi:putative endonuclease
MYYVYLIHSGTKGQFYYGYSNDLRRRLKEHKLGKCFSTSGVKDWELIYYEAYRSSLDATNREKHLKKYGASIGHLKKRINNSLKSAG